MITSRLGREEKKRLCSRGDREGTCEDISLGWFTRHGYMVTVWRLPLSEQTSVHATLTLAMSLILLEAVIFPHDIGHRVKLLAQIPLGFDAQSQSVFSADYNTIRCIQRYWFLPGAESRTVPGEPVRLSGYERSSP